ncbi:GNAT family N-acetyltransferase [Rhizomonospora bruguierae]|uniref:GNAT family N-acetyltransferase n=1 Tax=Rhizomonospora bruguierae TaxID=1581705 RepID=UPI001BCA9B37|nr:GNAT family N-acetyltransferase [Micromonospora sp. NBRC 107566]
MNRVVFSRTDELGEFALRPVEPADTALLHGWLTHPRSAYWLMLEATPEEVAKECEGSLLGLHGGRPAFLAQRYDPRPDLGHLYPAEDGDVGMHFLVAPAGTPVHGFTRAVLVTVMAALFADPAARRVVVEPDVRNTAVHRLNAYVGFRVLGRVRLPHKEALLSVCTRADFEAATEGAR